MKKRCRIEKDVEMNIVPPFLLSIAASSPIDAVLQGTCYWLAVLSLSPDDKHVYRYILEKRSLRCSFHDIKLFNLLHM